MLVGDTLGLMEVRADRAECWWMVRGDEKMVGDTLVLMEVGAGRAQ
jgi:hypothetical protein